MPQRENSKARVALTLSLVGFCLLGITSIIGIILGVLALREIDASGGTQKGRGKAITAIVIGGLIVLLWLPTYVGGGS